MFNERDTIRKVARFSDTHGSIPSIHGAYSGSGIIPTDDTTLPGKMRRITSLWDLTSSRSIAPTAAAIKPAAPRHGMQTASGEFIGIFDADSFLPVIGSSEWWSDLMIRGSVSFVQTRRGYMNHEDNLLDDPPGARI